MTHHYDDPQYSYPEYWTQRSYEQQAETIALTSLLRGYKFPSCVDIGAGFGRLVPTLHRFCRRIILIDPSARQRSLAQKYLAASPSLNLSHFTILSGTAQSTRLPARTTSLAVLIRVAHHLPNLLQVFQETHRILKPGGIFIFEFANSQNFKSRLKSMFVGQPILLTPLEKRSSTNIKKNSIPFVNHHPATVKKLLLQSGFAIDQILSVSNFRHPLIKQVLPISFLLTLEKISQPLLSPLFFGPSIFIKAHKIDN
ncbi:hypothetical protein A2W16_01365 [Candidatus Amesbacteria bacterium RBG_16_48_31]|nr:MAG: hypothetical protein A2W16_01365 [Candidatus Amesbacteria bacterium RBG_16_48_31]